MAFDEYNPKSGYLPQGAGPQNPGKYPIPVGSEYLTFGEQPGWIYDPYSNKYYPDQKAQQGYYESTGLQEGKPKEPGMFDSLAPLAGAAGAYALAQGFGKDPGAFTSGIWGGIKDAAGGLFDLGSGAVDAAGSALSGGSTAATSAATASPLAEVAATQAGAPVGMMGLGQGAGAASAIPTGMEAVGTMADGSAMLAPASAAAEAPGMFSLSGVGGAGNLIAPAAGALGAYDLFSNYGDRSDLMNIGEGAASGAAMGSFFPGAGTLIGGAVGGLVGLGLSMFGGDEDKWKTEGQNLVKLHEKGVYVPENLMASMPTSGRELEDLIVKDLPRDFIGRDSNGNWVNNKFASSRDVKDLRPEDIVNYSAFAENDPDWFRKPLEERLVFADNALKSNAVKEGHGTIKVDFKKVGSAPSPAQGQAPAAGTPAPQPVQATPPAPSVAANTGGGQPAPVQQMPRPAGGGVAANMTGNNQQKPKPTNSTVGNLMGRR